MVVDDNDVQLDAFLAEDRPQCLFDVFFFIPRRDDDTDFCQDTINFALRERLYRARACDRDFKQDEQADRKQRNKRRKEEQGLHSILQFS